MMTDNELSVPVIELTDVSKTYTTGNEELSVIAGLSLTVERGKKIVIAGESGSGKSTLLNIIGGLDAPVSGSVRVCGYDVARLDEAQLTAYRRGCIGLVFQFHYLLKDFTALENVFLPAYMAGCPKKTALERAEQLLRDVGLAQRLEHLPSQLSGGERQRTAVARALINDPQVILADEPTGNLDPANAELIGSLLFDVAEKYDKTLVLVTHDMKLARRGDLCYTIRGGCLEQAE